MFKIPVCPNLLPYSSNLNRKSLDARTAKGLEAEYLDHNPNNVWPADRRPFKGPPSGKRSELATKTGR